MKKIVAVFLLLGCGTLQAEPADDVDCVRCINRSDLASGAVVGGKIKRETITGDRLMDAAISGDKIADYAVSREKIAPELEIELITSTPGIGRSDQRNLIASPDSNLIAPDVHSAAILSGTKSYIGIETHTKHGTDPGFIPGEALHSIIIGYDNLANGIASTAITKHGFISGASNHGTLLGGGWGRIESGANGIILGGGGGLALQNVIAGGDSGAIVGGNTHLLDSNFGAIIGGTGSAVYGNGSLSLGGMQANTVTGADSLAMGRNVYINDRNLQVAFGADAIGGTGATLTIASPKIDNDGDAQTLRMTLRGQTTDATTRAIYASLSSDTRLNSFGNYHGAWRGQIMLQGMDTVSGNVVAYDTVEFVITWAAGGATNVAFESDWEELVDTIGISIAPSIYVDGEGDFGINVNGIQTAPATRINWVASVTGVMTHS